MIFIENHPRKSQVPKPKPQRNSNLQSPKEIETRAFWIFFFKRFPGVWELGFGT
jgi:hypothetical protein